MRGIGITVLAVMAVLVAGMGIGVTANEMVVPMGDIELKPPESIAARRSHVSFPHAVHFEYACQECHHQWDITEPIAGCMTSGCHELDTAVKRSKNGKVDPDEAILYYKKAYHYKCIGCHKDLKKKGIELENKTSDKSRMIASGPTGCIECHPED